MARPIPSIEDTKIRTTISLPRKVHALAERYRELHPEENLSDFSAVVAVAIINYASIVEPRLFVEVIAQIKLERAPEKTPKPTRRGGCEGKHP